MVVTVQRTVEISWKPSYGNYVQVRHGVIFLKNFVLGKQHITALIVGHVRACGINFFKLRGVLDQEWVFIDGSYIRAHQHASGARHGFERAIGQSRGGRTTKIHLATDANGLPIDFKITGGEVHDSQVAAQLICEIGQADYLIADKGYDSEKIRILARKQNIVPIIPMKSNSKRENKEFDQYLYRLRHLVENAFSRLKHFRAIATRFDKLARNYQSMVYIACMLIWCKAK
jgi:transposase